MGRKARQHWYSLYKSIGPRIDAYAGEGSVYELIREESEAVGYDAKVVKRMLHAGTFLDNYAGRYLSVEDVRCGYAHIELLERLSKLDPASALARINGVLANEVTLKELRTDLLGAQHPGEAQLSARSKARQRITDHRRLSVQLIKLEGAAFFGNPAAEMILVHRFRSLGQFVLLDDPERPIAVIPRLGDTSLKIPKAAEQLLKLAQSYKRNFYRIWLVLPADSPLASDLIALAYEIGALEEWLYLAVPNEDESGLLQYRNRHRLLEKQLYGEDDDYWEGVSLLDGRTLRGSLRP